ncbi:hypothetical protein FB45DRAFT_916524 [Roridomyces roridus]|uniref:Homeobox domain-containing protein n=1 Tax=Roridomyces roridus TaxID=1738132 RepID=A0AAD7BU48_9AGAR|nr:hypothetical protein FB45DRAFT_916524 [Roridomyces roridus]
MHTSLDLLADAADAQRSYDSYDPGYISSSCPSSPETRPTRSVVASYPRHLRPRKAAHKPLKGSRVTVKKSKPELNARRKELLDRAYGIKSLENSPVNEQQLFVLRTVYNEITMYPTEPWLALMAVVLHRSLRQVKNWFSNCRQKNGSGEAMCSDTLTDVGERVRLRPSAIELCQWSDAFFEEVIMILNFRTARQLHWERTRASNQCT